MHDESPGVDSEDWKGGQDDRSHLADPWSERAGRKQATVEVPGHQEAEDKDRKLGGGCQREGRVREANAAR